MPSCCVLGCDSGSFRQERRAVAANERPKPFFNFPKDEALANQWKQNLTFKEDFYARKEKKVCEDHFYQHDILKKDLITLENGEILQLGRKKYFLKQNAVPIRNATGQENICPVGDTSECLNAQITSMSRRIIHKLYTIHIVLWVFQSEGACVNLRVAKDESLQNVTNKRPSTVPSEISPKRRRYNIEVPVTPMPNAAIASRALESAPKGLVALRIKSIERGIFITPTSNSITTAGSSRVATNSNSLQDTRRESTADEHHISQNEIDREENYAKPGRSHEGVPVDEKSTKGIVASRVQIIEKEFLSPANQVSESTTGSIDSIETCKYQTKLLKFDSLKSHLEAHVPLRRWTYNILNDQSIQIAYLEADLLSTEVAFNLTSDLKFTVIDPL
ncbi:hypothetical protein QAD02_013655 [Eretmocerus hayati]|uniref:Uncharacterized protein n=1 Tax=Eretmocerus hayati TaxID=131215 RepID=A0ACC2P449_9HYME|nr:hypothetical protein QAD02_013655 [Eretmocerus hayati]